MEGISSRQNVAQTNHNQADICAWGTICGPFAIKMKLMLEETRGMWTYPELE